MYTILNNSKSYSGNNTTLNRLEKLLNLKTVNTIQDNIIGIHAFKFGKLVINKNINFILIIGGTDVNIDIYDNNKLSIIMKACKQAKYIVAFNKVIKNKILKLDNILSKKIKIIPQSIKFIEPTYFDIRSLLKNIYNVTNVNKFFLCVGNIRPVKDPMFLKKSFNKLQKENIYLIFIGNISSGDYNFTDGMIHIGPLEHKYILSCLEQSNGLINTSISEGMAVSILESMIHKCPVYCRNNESNSNIIKHSYNGYLFNTPGEFEKLLKLDTKNIINDAYHYVLNKHNPIDEQQKYLELL
jgi:glycosyltransferase involved in cell wall biosynthesis